jgi:chromosome segregation ATPase
MNGRSRILADGIVLLLLALLLCCWVLPSGTASASGTYTITEEELVRLEDNLSRLKSINTRLQTESATQKEQAKVLLEQVTRLQSQLATLREASQKQQDLLTNANKSLAEYATEAKRTRLRIKAQRNTWLTVAVAAVIAAVAK